MSMVMSPGDLTAAQRARLHVILSAAGYRRSMGNFKGGSWKTYQRGYRLTREGRIWWEWVASDAPTPEATTLHLEGLQRTLEAAGVVIRPEPANRRLIIEGGI